MAKKGNRKFIHLVCSVCKVRNYTSIKNTLNTKDKLELNKFCPRCRKHTSHQEQKIS
ncbi:MAG: 50S ribosomal protein L33 [bacterium]|nr:50S ribosomal protein L33 [bacterium]